MKNKIYNLLILSLSMLICFSACDKEAGFEYDIKVPDNADVDSILFSPNHTLLIDDGISQLGFNLKLFSIIEEEFTNSRTGEKETKEVLYPIDLADVPKGEVKYFYQEEGKDPVKLDQNYLIPNGKISAPQIKVFAEIFGTKTKEYEVSLRSALEDNDFYKEKSIPVVFHILEYSGKKNTDFKLGYEHIEAKMNRLNDLFSRKLNVSPNGVDTRVRFVAATHSPDGAKLDNPGMHVFNIGAETVEASIDPSMIDDYYIQNGPWKDFNFSKYLEEKSLVWNHKNYLNIWIIPTKEYVSNKFPPTVVQTGHPLAGLYMQQIDGDKDTYTVNELGILNAYSNFANGALEINVGTYFGLLQTYGYRKITSDVDFCDDTFVFNLFGTRGAEKYDPLKDIYFRQNNIMDGTFTATTITKNQAERIHHILNYSPTRMMWK
ncbi:MAG: hypothetical protein N4A59_14635 [Marinifilum sp.]|nr:hypothetical protein [Marinifilum sp.]